MAITGDVHSQVKPPLEKDARLAEEIANLALESLYKAFYEQLVRHAAWRHGLSKEDSCEVVQEAFLLAIEKLDSSGNPKAWIYRVVGNLAANWKRKASRRARLLAEWSPTPEGSERGEGGEP